MLNKNYTELKQRIQLGSFIIQGSDYPFAAFSLGYLLAKTNVPLQDLFQVLQSLYQLIKNKTISIIVYKQFIQILEDRPSQIKQIKSTLKKIINGSQINIIQFIQSLYTKKIQLINQKQIMNGSNGINHKKQEKYQNIQEINNTIPLQNDGTQELDDLLNGQSQNGDGNNNFYLVNNNDNMQKNRMEMQAMDIELARKMQQEFNNQYKAPIQEDCPCQICYVNLFDQQIQTLECGDIFHKNCLIQSYKSNILSNTFPLRCPSDQCKLQVSERDLRNIFPKQLFEKYQKHTLKAYADQHGDSISWCPTANCGYMFFHEKGDSERFQCLQCRKQYCLNCRVDWHKDMSCKQYKITNTISQDDEKFMNFVKGKKFKQCPKCKFWVQKNEGCDHMTCKCKFEFCYKCGGVYMKCQCIQNQRIQMQNRRRLNQQRNKAKLQRKQDNLRKKRERQQKARQKQQIKKQKLQQKQSKRPKRR